MKGIKTLGKYFFYCGIEKEEYNAVKKDAYVSNFVLWRILHYVMAFSFLLLFFASFFNDILGANRYFYVALLGYAIVAIIFFSFLRKDSIVAQFLIYLSITILMLFGCLITRNNPTVPAASFIAILLITPMFMIDKPFFMTINLCFASSFFLIWMYHIKPYNIWRIDVSNVVPFTLVSILINIISNSIRIKEFVLRREINIQKDMDELTGLKNKGALTRAINKYLADKTSTKGLMFMLDIDRFKAINDTYGHDIGDFVIAQLGHFLGEHFTHQEIVGRFGGDEFIVFIKNSDDKQEAREIAESIVKGASDFIKLPDNSKKVSVSIGIAIYRGEENNYSEIFKKADTALYTSKANSQERFFIYE